MSAPQDIDDRVNNRPTLEMERLIFDEAMNRTLEGDDLPDAIKEIGKDRGFKFTYEDIYEIIRSNSEDVS